MAYELVLAFDRDSPDFVLGVEVGILHSKLRAGQLPLSAMVHPGNTEMCLRLAEAHSCRVRADDLGDWLAVEFS